MTVLQILKQEEDRLAVLASARLYGVVNLPLNPPYSLYTTFRKGNDGE